MDIADRRPVRAPLAVALAGAALVAIGVVLRGWLVTHRTLTGDEALVGLMAQAILDGDPMTFFWGQHYGGVEPYVVAFFTALLGDHPFVVKGVTVLLTATSCVLVALIAWRIVPPGRRWLAAVAGAAVWAWPAAVLWQSTRQVGFRGVTMAAGLTAVLFALRAVETRHVRDLVLTGLAFGVAWWSSPESVYFAPPLAVILVGGLLRSDGDRRPAASALVRPLAVVVTAAAVGAAPWIWTNLHTGFASLESGSSPAYVPSTYPERLETVARGTTPLMLGLRVPATGEWLGGWAGIAVAAVAMAGVAWAVWRCLVGGRGTRWIAVGVLAFPFLSSLFPATSNWTLGSYGMFLVPLMVLALVAAVAGATPRQAWLVPVGAVVAAALVGASTLVSFERQWGELGGAASDFTGAWRDPHGAVEETVDALERQGIRHAFANYWVAYPLTYIGDGRVEVAAADQNRWVEQYLDVSAAPTSAWLFTAEERRDEAAEVFHVSIAGPFGVDRARFEAMLGAAGIAYEVRRAGLVDAVVPARPVTGTDVGLPPPFWD